MSMYYQQRINVEPESSPYRSYGRPQVSPVAPKGSNQYAHAHQAYNQQHRQEEHHYDSYQQQQYPHSPQSQYQQQPGVRQVGLRHCVTPGCNMAPHTVNPRSGMCTKCERRQALERQSNKPRGEDAHDARSAGPGGAQLFDSLSGVYRHRRSYTPPSPGTAGQPALVRDARVVM